MEQEREKVLKEAREEIASLVILTTSKVLEKELTEDEKSPFFQNGLRESSKLINHRFKWLQPIRIENLPKAY